MLKRISIYTSVMITTYRLRMAFDAFMVGQCKATCTNSFSSYVRAAPGYVYLMTISEYNNGVRLLPKRLGTASLRPAEHASQRKRQTVSKHVLNYYLDSLPKVPIETPAPHTSTIIQRLDLFSAVPGEKPHLAGMGARAQRSATKVAAILARPQVPRGVVPRLTIRPSNVLPARPSDLSVVLADDIARKEFRPTGQVAGEGSSAASDAIDTIMSTDVGSTLELVRQVCVGSVGVAGVEADATAAVCLDGASDEWAGFADADLGRGGEARVDLVAGAVYVNRIDTIWLACGNDEPCHTGQEDRKSNSSSEMHLDGCKVLK
jgi:hypothetical protein